MNDKSSDGKSPTKTPNIHQHFERDLDESRVLKKRRKEPDQVCVFLDPVNTKTWQVSKYLNSWGFVFAGSKPVLI